MKSGSRRVRVSRKRLCSPMIRQNCLGLESPAILRVRSRNRTPSPPARSTAQRCTADESSFWPGLLSTEILFLCCATCASFSRDPLANVWIAIHQRDASRFAPGEKIDTVLTRQSHLLEVENDAAALRFRGDECFQLGDMLCVEPAAYRKNHFPVFQLLILNILFFQG